MSKIILELDKKDFEYNLGNKISKKLWNRLVDIVNSNDYIKQQFDDTVVDIFDEMYKGAK